MDDAPPQPQPESHPHPRPMRADARRNYEHIVATARTAFAELGPEAPLDVVARRAGVGPGTLYRHFPTREVLIAAVYGPDIAALAAHAAGLAEREAPGAALERWVREHLVDALGQHGIATTLRTALARAPEILQPHKDRFMDATETLVGAAQEAGTVRRDIETRDILRLVHGVAAASADSPSARTRMLRVLFDGLRPA
ncbi:TetR/AcrR family transcriptional regulator [Streptomyces sp. B3I8]|uniref:TetR/AcrR family transcriptional regulator n=1 Tax=Streptomyces sp. B3I8 TaxID=3042303 RepID=UPI00277F51A7|nr:TetR/AcrR family transcriptional regulator [Streptomyces sp. B3I8]MDQ0788989.1 AcrR family transcriptional regulator [Streptomyces sp. B3I8]